MTHIFFFSLRCLHNPTIVEVSCQHAGCPYRTKRKDFLKKHIPKCTYKTSVPAPAVTCPHAGCTYEHQNVGFFKKHLRRCKFNVSIPKLFCSYNGCVFTTHRQDFLKQHRGRCPFRKEPSLYKCQHPGCNYETSRKILLHGVHNLRCRFNVSLALVKCKYGCNFESRDKIVLGNHERTCLSPTTFPSPRVREPSEALNPYPPVSCIQSEQAFDLPWTTNSQAAEAHDSRLTAKFEQAILDNSKPYGTCCVCDTRLRGNYSEPIKWYASQWTKLLILERSFDHDQHRDECFSVLEKVPLSTAGMHTGGTMCMCSAEIDPQPHVVLCDKCASSCSKDTIPILSVADNWLGKVPECLQGLTMPERLVLCPGRLKIVVLRLKSWTGEKGSRQLGVKGHATVFPQVLPFDIGRNKLLQNVILVFSVCIQACSSTSYVPDTAEHSS